MVLDGVLDGKRIAVMPWDAGHGAAAQDAVFPVLIDRLVQWLAAPPSSSVTPGAVVTLPASIASVRDPSGALLSGPLVTAE